MASAGADRQVTEADAERPASSRLRTRLGRIGLAAAIGVLTLNVWTGAPLLALWVGSRVQGDGPPEMGAIFVVAIVLAATAYVLVRLIGVLSGAYDRTAGQERTVRRHAPWLRSMRGERERYPGDRATLTAPERILIAMVVVAAAAFEIWFFFFSGSPIDQRSGRTQLPPRHAPLGALASSPKSAGEPGPVRG